MSKSILPILSPQSGLLRPSKGNLTINLDSAIHLHGPCLEFLADSHGTIDILSEDRGGETEISVVGFSNGFGFGFEGIDNDDWAEDFFFFDGAAGFGICEDGWFDEESLKVRHSQT
jgi:hypothetical protein